MSTAKPSEEKRPSNQELQIQYNTFKSTIQSLSEKIGELEGDLDEHKLVLGTLKDMPSDRKCFRMVGGTLIESTVKEVVPALESNSSNLKTVIETLSKDLRKTQEELTKWKVKYKVQIVQS